MGNSSSTTLRTLAAEAQVCPMTVSLALRNHPSISAATRARLQQLAELRGYRPDPTIVKLMHHLRARRPVRIKSVICALNNRDRGDNDVYVAGIVQAAQRRAKELGYAFEEVFLKEYRQRPGRLRAFLRSKNIEGMLILPLSQREELDHLLDWKDFSVVATSYSILTPHFHRVVPHMFSNLNLACQVLAARGYRRIGLAITSNLDLRTYHYFTAVIALHNSEAANNAVAPLIHPDPNVKRVAAWIKQEKPDVVVTMSALPGMEAAEHTGLSVPRDIGVMHLSRQGNPRYAAIDERPEEIGATAIELLASMVQRGEKGIPRNAKVTMIEGSWIEGKTVRAAKKARES